MKNPSAPASFSVLDCTIRDGGYINEWAFDFDMVRDVYRRLSRAGADFVELGFRNSQTGRDGEPVWRSCPEDVLRKIRGGLHGARVSVLVDFGKADVNDFLPAPRSAIDMVRVAVNRNAVPAALEFLAALSDKGYLTSLQLMGFPQYSDTERQEVLAVLEQAPVDYVYMADSYGTLFPDQVASLVGPLLECGSFQVGFHPHNNLQLALANSLEAVRAGVRIVDSTLYGMGRGAGNLPTEVLFALLQEQEPERFNLLPVLDAIDMYMVPLHKRYEWGYQLPYMLSGICQCHPNYARELVEARRYTIGDVWQALRTVQEGRPVGFDRELLERVQDSSVLEFGNEEALNAELGGDLPDAVVKGPPTYMARHTGRIFLVLANGPGLVRHADGIREFIERHDPVILGANYLDGTFVPHYHAFINRKRFARYASSVATESGLLLSCHFSDELACEYVDRDYERLLFRRGDRDVLSIDDGVISNDCSSVAMLLISVASVMGAREVYVAGMDGYLQETKGGGHYFYDEADDSDSAEFNRLRHRWGERTLRLLDERLASTGRGGVNIITPTAYRRYYRAIRTLL